MIHDLATCNRVVAVVTTDSPRRPAVASKAAADDTARHTVDKALFGRFGQLAQLIHESVAPPSQRLEHSA